MSTTSVVLVPQAKSSVISSDDHGRFVHMGGLFSYTIRPRVINRRIRSVTVEAKKTRNFQNFDDFLVFATLPAHCAGFACAQRTLNRNSYNIDAFSIHLDLF